MRKEALLPDRNSRSRSSHDEEGGASRRPDVYRAQMDNADVALRDRAYGLFVEFGRAPSLDEAASAAGLTMDEAAAGWQRQHDAHALPPPCRGSSPHCIPYVGPTRLPVAASRSAYGEPAPGRLAWSQIRL